MHINFAPDKKFEFNWKNLKRFKLTRVNMIIVAAVVLSIMFFFGIVQKARLAFIQSERVRIDELNNRMQQEAQAKGLSVSQTAGKTPAIRSYDDRIVWSSLLYSVSDAVSSGIWLGNFEGSAADRSLKLTGEATDHPTVASFVAQLSKVP
jgi:hypothetical protein